MGPINFIDIDWPDLLKPIPIGKTGIFHRLRINREIIPIIFVPGIMGSRLKNSKTGESVWDPDKEIMCMLRKYGGFWNTPAQRKRMLIGNRFNPDYLEVNERDARHNVKFAALLDRWREDRGWGGVFWGSYGKFLLELQNHDWDKLSKPGGNCRADDLIGKCFEFPVHAFGYNWTDSNWNSGHKLALKIDEIIAMYKSRKRLCKQVILVSHSMGGLVCRSACKIHHAESKVLGVVHGVQPATGSAAAYWRMKAGFERTGEGKFERLLGKASAWVLGTNGEEVTCILGNAPGGLELLPNQYYTDNEGKTGWLRVPQKDGKEILFPQRGNPYEEIYEVKADVFWRMINPEWLAPIDKKSPPTNPYKRTNGAWNDYRLCLKFPIKFHTEVGMYSHNNTYSFHSSGLKTADKITFSREKLNFTSKHCEIPTDFGDTVSFDTEVPSRERSSRGTSITYVDQNDREIQQPLPMTNSTQVLVMSQIEKNSAGGDGTVPVSSGNALKTVQYDYNIEGVEHQGAYADGKAKRYVISAIRNLAIKRIGESEVESAR